MASKRKKPSKKAIALAYLRGVAPAMKLLWQSLCFTLHRLWVLVRWTARMWMRLPMWAKGTKVLLIALLIVALPLIDSARQWMHYREIYNSYYDHYIQTEEPYRADYYAQYYAKYYSSAAYRNSLRYALPSASEETVAYPDSSPVATSAITTAGLALIKSFEGLELDPYEDAGGKLTIGYGHLVKPGEYFTRLTEKKAHKLLREDVRVAEAYVKRYVRVKLNPNQFSALVSLVYNIGPGNFRKSTLLKLLNKGQGDRAASEFLRWNKVNGETLAGLARRREAEMTLFGTPTA